MQRVREPCSKRLVCSRSCLPGLRFGSRSRCPCGSSDPISGFKQPAWTERSGGNVSRWGVRCLRSRSQKGVENVTVLSSILYPLSSILLAAPAHWRVGDRLDGLFYSGLSGVGTSLPGVISAQDAGVFLAGMISGRHCLCFQCITDIALPGC